MSSLSKYNSSSPELRAEIKESAKNPTVIARQYGHFLQAGTGLLMSDPEWCLAPLAPLLDGMAEEKDFGTAYDYMPDRMSYELYGTHELWPILLRLNGAEGRHAFVGPRLRYIRADSIGRFLEMLRFGVARAERADSRPPLEAGNLTVREVLV